jgi:hypothetical protein
MQQAAAAVVTTAIEATMGRLSCLHTGEIELSSTD